MKALCPKWAVYEIVVARVTVLRAAPDCQSHLREAVVQPVRRAGQHNVAPGPFGSPRDDLGGKSTDDSTDVSAVGAVS